MKLYTSYCRNCKEKIKVGYGMPLLRIEMCHKCIKEHEDEYNKWLYGKPFKRNPLKQVQRISFKFINNLISMWRKLC